MERDRVLEGAIEKVDSLLFLSFSSVSKMLLQSQDTNDQKPKNCIYLLQKIIERVGVLDRCKSGRCVMRKCDLKIRIV